MSNLKIDDVVFSYDKDIILDKINILIEQGIIITILGLNGSGKTTLLKLINQQLKSKTGTVFIDDADILKMTKKEISKHISFVSQLSKDNNDFLVIDYLSLGLVNSLAFYNSPSDEQIKKIKEIAEAMGISNLLNKNMDNLSGGEKQMVKICSAIIQDTNIILLDEPLSALDIKNQNKVIKLLRKLNQQGKTIIMTTHNPNICLYLNAKVVLLKDGKIINHGNAVDIITPTNLKPIYGEDIVYVKDTKYYEVTFKQD